MKSKLSMLSRVLLVVAAAGLIFVLYLPIWRIELDAPQYPEGLALKIHANGLKGNVDIINGLNHYIGMKTLHNEDFIEFTILPYAIIFFSVLFALAAILNRRRWLNLAFFLFVAFGIIAMVDFWRWEYNYGHNLDPNAAIVVPGMAYQPPLIGFKQLLNFGAYSIPDQGGWIFIGAGVLVLFCVIMEWRKSRTAKKRLPVNVIMLLSASMLLNSCSGGPQPVIAGRDNCYLCKMAITDIRYAAELVTEKGKVYIFDDVFCLQSFMKTGMQGDTKVKDIYLADFSGEHSLVKAGESFLLQGGDIRGPMNGNVIAFKNMDSMKMMAERLNAVAINWEQVNK
jgi:copper chaperone NosL